MEESRHDTDELSLLASANGPTRTDPPFVRAAFPLAALPRVLRDYVERSAAGLGVVPECVATPALAVCAAAIGATCRIRLTRHWSEPAVLWAVTLMESGSLKTPAYNAAVDPLKALQRLHEEEYVARKAAYVKEKRRFDEDAAAWRAQTLQTVGRDAPTQPVEPQPVDLYTSDCTVEALAMLFAANPRGLALTRDELSGFLASFGAYKGGRGNDESTYLEYFNAGAVKLNRASGKRIAVAHAALSIFGTCQPVVFSKLIGATGKGPDQVENGLAARFILCAPEPKVKAWHVGEASDPTEYARMLAQLYSIPLPVSDDGRTHPTLLDCHPDAVAVFRVFVNEHGVETIAIKNPALRYHYAKLEGIAARLALVLYLCEAASGEYDGQPGIQARHALGGVALARWYGWEARRFYGTLETQADRERYELLGFIAARGGVVSPRAVHRAHRNLWKDTAAAEVALWGLVRSGYGTLAVETSPDGNQALRFRLKAPTTGDSPQQIAQKHGGLSPDTEV
jgi:hypothetical protein